MPRKADTKHLQVYMSQSALDVVIAHAASLGYSITVDYVRALIEQDLAKHGKSVDFGIDRGGWRGGPKNKA